MNTITEIIKKEDTFFFVSSTNPKAMRGKIWEKRKFDLCEPRHTPPH
jgi:hypothetical protein